MKKYDSNDLKKLLNSVPYDIMIKEKDKEEKAFFSNDKFCRIFNVENNDNTIKNNSLQFWKEIMSENNIDINSVENSTSFESKIDGCCSDKYIVSHICSFESQGKRYTGVIGKDITLDKKVNCEIKKTSQLMTNLEPKYNYSIKSEMQFIIKGIFEEMSCEGIGLLFYENSDLVKYASCGIYIDSICKLLKKCDESTIKIEQKEIKVVKLNYFNDVIGYLYLIYNNTEEILENEINKAIQIGDRISVIITNILLSNQIKTEYVKRKSTDREFELFLETATDLCVILKNDADIVSVNERCLDLLGYTKEEFMQHSSVLDFIHKDDLNKLKKEINISTYKKIPGKILCRALCKDKSIRMLDIHWNFIESKKVILITAQDKTEQMRLKSENRKLKDVISLENLKTDFLSNVSHEFKTPLNIILLSTQLMLSDINSGKEINCNQFEKNMKRIKQNSNKLLSLINNLIDMTKIQDGFYTLELKKYNIVEVVENIVDSVADYIENRKRNIIFDTEEEQISVLCDPEKIERILYNLFSNALKYTDEGGNIIIKMNYDNNKENVIISVKDDGIGVPKEKAKIIFDRFSRILSRDCEGSGIGLSLVRSLVALHKGNIWLNEANEKGAEFLISLPVDKSNEKIIDNRSALESKIDFGSANIFNA